MLGIIELQISSLNIFIREKRDTTTMPVGIKENQKE